MSSQEYSNRLLIYFYFYALSITLLCQWRNNTSSASGTLHSAHGTRPLWILKTKFHRFQNDVSHNDAVEDDFNDAIDDFNDDNDDHYDVIDDFQQNGSDSELLNQDLDQLEDSNQNVPESDQTRTLRAARKRPVLSENDKLSENLGLSTCTFIIMVYIFHGI